MQDLPIQFDLIETQTYLTIAVYIHYFSPGSLKLRTNIQFLSPESFEDTFHSPADLSTRRWLPPDESPYPGYCRAPGSNKCSPILCNCDALTELWNKIQVARASLRNTQLEAQMKKQRAKLRNAKGLTKDASIRASANTLQVSEKTAN